jgi:hypothetical protein
MGRRQNGTLKEIEAVLIMILTMLLSTDHGKLFRGYLKDLTAQTLNAGLSPEPGVGCSAAPFFDSAFCAHLCAPLRKNKIMMPRYAKPLPMSLSIQKREQNK